MKSVCMIVEDYPPDGGGGGIFVKELSKRLIKKYKITVVTGGEKEGTENKDGFDVVRLGKNRISFFLKALKYLIFHPAFDLYHAHGIFAGLIARKMKLIKKRPIILHMHGYRDKEINGFAKHNIQNSLIKLSYDRIISVDENSAKKIIALGVLKKKISIIPCGIDTKKFRPAKNKGKHKNKIFLFVGRLEKVKNVGLLLEAFKELKREGLTPKLWIVGTGSLEKELTEYCKKNKLDNVKFFGAVLHEKLPGIYQKADFFILPSKSEGNPLSLLEAMACGLPFIVSDVYNLRKIADESMAGITFNGDLKEKTEKFILMDEKEIEKRKGKLKKYVKNSFEWGMVAGKIGAVYKRTVSDFSNSSRN